MIVLLWPPAFPQNTAAHVMTKWSMW